MNPIARNAKSFWTGIIYVLVGGSAIFMSQDYGMGTAVKMGPAYFPTILSGLLILIGSISVVRSFLKPGTPIGTFAFKGLLLVIAATVLFGLIVRGAGTIIALASPDHHQCLCKYPVQLAIRACFGSLALPPSVF